MNYLHNEDKFNFTATKGREIETVSSGRECSIRALASEYFALGWNISEIVNPDNIVIQVSRAQKENTLPGIEPHNQKAQQIADYKRKKEAPREHVPTGQGPGDLFSGKAKQTELF